MTEVLVCFIYNILLYHFVSIFCIIVTKSSLEAECNSVYTNRVFYTLFNCRILDGLLQSICFGMFCSKHLVTFEKILKIHLKNLLYIYSIEEIHQLNDNKTFLLNMHCRVKSRFKVLTFIPGMIDAHKIVKQTLKISQHLFKNFNACFTIRWTPVIIQLMLHQELKLASDKISLNTCNC